MTEVPVPPLLAVTAVEALPGFQLRLTFENGEIRRFRMVRLLTGAAGVFTPLRRVERFGQVFVANGTVCWPGDVDLDPELLYQESAPENREAEGFMGVANGLFDIPDEHDYPRDPEWESMPDVGREVWPRDSEDRASWARAQAQALRTRDVAHLDWEGLADEMLGVARLGLVGDSPAEASGQCKPLASGIDLEVALQKFYELGMNDGDLGYDYWYQIGKLLKRATGMQAEIDALSRELERCRAR